MGHGNLLGEVIHPTVILGGAIIIAGVTLTNRRRKPQAVLATEGERPVDSTA